MENICENIRTVNARISEACSKSDRQKSEIKLVAVSKRKPLTLVAEALECGQLDFGENSAQELRDKARDIENNDVIWHFIGNLQKNKIKYVAPVATMIHSVSSLELASAINAWLESHPDTGPIDALIQIHTGKEEEKHGVNRESFLNEMQQWKALANLRFCGVMTMATNTTEEGEIRRCFAEARNFFDELKRGDFPEPHFQWLSMGMTNDFEIAIEEGANLLRIGSAIFGQRQ